MSDPDGKNLTGKMRGRSSAGRDAHRDLSMVREGLRTWRLRALWLFSMSGFLLIAVGMVLVPIAVVIAWRHFGEFRDPLPLRSFLHSALGHAIFLLLLGVVFKLYATSIDLEIWYYSLIGAQPRSSSDRRTRFLKLATMFFLVLAMVSIVWGLTMPPAVGAEWRLSEHQGGLIHIVDVNRLTLLEKSHRVAVISLLMGIVSLVYHNQVKMDLLRKSAEGR